MARRASSYGRLLLLPALVVTAASGCHPKSAAPKPTPAPVVQVAPVVQRDVAIRQEWVGSLDGFVNAQIRAQVTGYLMRQAYVDGAPVKKGDLLFEIDPRTFEAARNQVKASFDKAAADLKRTSVLTEENAASTQDRDNAQHAYEAEKAALNAVQLNLDFTRITSPVDGVAGVAAAQIGDLVGPNSGVLTTVSTLDPIKADFAISEQSYLTFREARPGQPPFPEGLELELILTDGREYPRKGRVYSTDRAIDPNTGTLRLVGVFPNPELILRPGQYGRVRAVVRTERNALLVPQRAVAELQGSYLVTTVDAQNKAHVRTVTVGDRDGSMWIVQQGLNPGDRVVVEGLQKVREGMAVEIQPAAVAEERPAPPADAAGAK